MKQSILFVIFLVLLGCTKTENPNEVVRLPDTVEESSDDSTNDDSNEENGSDESEENSLQDLYNDFQNFMANRGISGGQLAITRNEKLIYYRSAGFSDKESKTEVNDSSLFRIASISKPITLLAISKLVSENKLKMTDQVFGSGKILGTDYGSAPYASNIGQITVDHLVEHKAGFKNEPYDIMFDEVNLTQDELIGKVLDERALGSTPGGVYYYSNFGYCLLGRIIEKVSGMDYEEYVQREILAPMGITEMKIGGSTFEEKFENEVSYYSSWFSPYNMNIKRMDSHGGWIASAKDLALFSIHTDTRGNNDIIKFGDVQSYMEFGNYAHFGALPGTMSIISVSSPFSYSVVFNSGNSNYEVIQNEFIDFMNEQFQSRQNWPSKDLF